MSSQVERLEELLARVERNRNKPRAAAAISASIAEKTAKDVPDKVSQLRAAPSEPPIAESPAPRTVPKAAPLPDEAPLSPPQAAVESRFEASRPAPAPKPEPQPAVFEQPVKAEPVKIPAAPVTRPSGAVAEVVSKLPKVEEETFGRLLDRTLSLRPY